MTPWIGKYKAKYTEMGNLQTFLKPENWEGDEQNHFTEDLKE